MNKTISIIIAVLLVLVVGFVVFKNYKHKGHNCKHKHSIEKRADWMTERVSKKLNLNEEQKGKLESIRMTVVSHMEDHRESRKSSVDRLLKMMENETMQIEELDELVGEQQTRVEEFKNEILPQIVSFYNSLSADQREKLKTFAEKFRSHKKKHKCKSCDKKES